jgi:hypothetical protein
MMAVVDDAPRARSPFWRVVQLVAGAALFLFALRLLPPMPLERGAFVLIAALLAAGAMAVSDSVVGMLANLFETLQKGRRP